MHALCLHLSVDLLLHGSALLTCLCLHADVGVFMVARICWPAYACVHALVYLCLQAYVSCLRAYAGLLMAACERWCAYVCTGLFNIGMPMPTFIRWRWHAYVCMHAYVGLLMHARQCICMYLLACLVACIGVSGLLLFYCYICMQTLACLGYSQSKS